jgi:hypothetical protein
MDNYTGLAFDKIEEGQLMKDLQDELDLVQKALCRYRERYKGDALGAKAELHLKVTLKIEDPKDEFYSIVSAISSKQPGRPQRATLAIEGVDNKGRRVLYTRKSGSGKDHPDQTLLCTDDGRAIDQVTGEILEPETPETPAEDPATT